MKPANLLPRAHRVDRQPAGGVDLLAQGEQRLEVLQQWALLVVPGLLPATVLIEEGRGVGHDVVERVQRGRSSSQVGRPAEHGETEPLGASGAAEVLP